ncbi:non-specific serine/threonine protein kinase [Pelomonas saccharophila]|uniref:Non-specific serine/threonine protein kinase n=1 Tax=Roseateles saccharophilus TaxID=304 RepID=A0ABU1YIS4_ROSSA|nr:winged helix-turn-helix domain-containing protein [Roseateles saccharophilus]MDR7268749.1 non-specific serine/threonine protein kinase [Roseateles saccharophilus]
MDEAPAVLRFGAGGRFELRPTEHRLLVDGAPSPLGGRALDLLFALAARPGELLTKGELIEKVWPGLVVEEGNLRVQVNGLRRLLGEDAIATVPGRGYRFTALLQEAAATAPAEAIPAQALFGRDADLARLCDALAAGPGCVTLVGMAGVGKSSLARVAAGQGAWVDLAPLTQGGQVAEAIARALGGQLAGDDAVAQVIKLLPEGEPALLVLDNAEHLVDACATWAAALQSRLRLLVTSQLALGVAGERVLRVEPLAVAEGAEGAQALLLARIRAMDARFEATPKSLPLLAALCRQLDGLPLALELAAARVPLMGLQAVHDALAERFALLSRGRRDSSARHRSLLEALDWSHGLLEPAEQQLYQALGVFAGGFTLELAVTLSGDEHVSRWDVVDGLATLVERSLVSVDGADPPRYRLLETMRAHALARLDEAGRHSARRRHAAAVLALIAPSDDTQLWLADMENVREAFLWAREHDLATAAQLSARAARVMVLTVWRHEVTGWLLSLEPAMDARGNSLPPQVLALWTSMLSYLLLIRADVRAVPVARRAVTLWRPLGNPTELQIAAVHWVRAFSESNPSPELDEACALLQALTAGDDSPMTRFRVNNAMAVAERLRGNMVEHLACMEREQLAARELGMQARVQIAENNICLTLVRLGRLEEGAARTKLLLESLDADGSGNNGALPWVLNALVEALVGLDRLDEAAALVPRSLAVGRRFGTHVAWMGILPLLAAQRRVEAACRLAGYVRRVWTAAETTLDPVELKILAGAVEPAQALLGRDRAAALEAEGRGLDEGAATALAGS